MFSGDICFMSVSSSIQESKTSLHFGKHCAQMIPDSFDRGDAETFIRRVDMLHGRAERNGIQSGNFITKDATFQSRMNGFDNRDMSRHKVDKVQNRDDTPNRDIHREMKA